MGNRKFVTADQHFNHGGIINSCDRPFKNIWSMNETMIRRWNEVVAPGDVVYSLGDMIFPPRSYGALYPERILSQLNGHIIYIPSQEHSHEKALIGCEKFFDKITPLLVIKEEVGEEKACITFCHYAFQIWPKSHFNSWHCHGHSHCRLNPIGKRLDVGVDGHNFYPWGFYEIAEYMKNQPDNSNYIGRNNEPME